MTQMFVFSLSRFFLPQCAFSLLFELIVLIFASGYQTLTFIVKLTINSFKMMLIPRKMHLEVTEKHVNMESYKPAIDLLFDEVSQIFWIVLFFYVIVSMIWIMYCCYINKM